MIIDKTKIKNSSILFLLIIRITYVITTIKILDGLWYYGGGYDINFNSLKEVLALCSFVIMAFYFRENYYANNFKSVVIKVLFILYYIPLNASFSIHNQTMEYFVLTNSYFFLLMFFCCKAMKIGAITISTKSEKGFKTYANYNQEKILDLLNKRAVRVVLFLICLICIVYKISYNGFTFALNIFSDSVYTTRESYVETMNAIDSTAVGYIATLIMNLAGYTVPFYLYLAIKKKNYFAGLVSVICLVSIFSVNSSKSAMIFIVIVFAIAFLEKRGGVDKFSSYFEVGIFLLLITSLLVYLIFKRYDFYFLILRREMFLPSWLDTKYYAFFENGPKILWSQGTFLLQKIIPSTYSEGYLKMINDNYFGGYVPSPNTGLFADAYMNLGIVGVLTYPMLISYVLNKSDGIYQEYGSGIMNVMAVKLAIHLTNVPLLRTDFILSYFLFTFVLWFVSKVK
ncbi:MULTISPECIES: hypothetical protein [Ruminococcus]|uniref:Oligosaccharide repeat unit polymerase n=1 Tax=Ruminococcus hominis TaxID=2763065 RepID=A0ABR7G5W3_9FIRM|nr:hypothetical protein [Ruminococcus hominis]MBC5682824.1 hypothetical protein [Ruminococcus hominis]RGH38590.1 hypothetical protein DW901_11345 [Firmicutes bacterium AM41-5BH]RHV04868.1 hypothetical protein DXB97_08110 [Firmicutes bacterium OM07-11]